jgi:DNA-binding SARP family transcriptional activator/Tfp pilus assembly protein PilF
MSAQGLRVFALGGFRIERGDDVITPDQWSRRPARQMFKCLLTRRTRRLPRDEAYELFWPRSEQGAAPSTLRGAMLAIRRLLEPGVDTRDSFLVGDPDMIGIRREADIWLDADAFERLLADARRTDDPAELLEEADRLYVGDYLPDDLYDDWATPRREALRNLWTELQFDLSRSREQRGNVTGAIRALQRLLERDRCDERAARELMLMLARHGRRSEALRVYQRLVEVLREELGADPSAETSVVQRQVASSDQGPASPPTGPDPSASQARPATSGSGRPNPVTVSSLSVHQSPVPPSPAPVPMPPFEPSYPFPTPDLLVGRQGDMLTVQHALERGLRGGQTILVRASAGTGKSALAGMLVDRARSMGFLCLAGGSFDHASPSPYGPIRDALTDYLLAQPPAGLRAALGELLDDLVPIVPELRYHLTDLAGRADASSDQRQILAAIHGCLRTLATQQPVLVFLDDIHAADGATLELLHYLARQTRRLRITLVAAYRTEEVSTNRALAHLLSMLARESLSQEIILRPLDRDETLILISSLLGGPASDGLTDSLHAVTEGNPLFIEQFVLALREERRIAQQHGVWHQTAVDDAPLPPVVQSVIERRFDRLPPSGRDTLTMASVLGQTFELRALVVALADDDEASAVAVLDRAIEAQLVRETASGYRFGHAMIRESLYRSSSGPRRALLHARAGAAIEALAGERAAERAAELAHHFALAAAVAPTAAQALHYSLEAGRRAASFTSHREALEHFVRACEIVDRHSGVDPSDREQALAGRFNAERELSMWTACIATCRRLLAETDDPARRGWARTSISRALCSLGDTPQALYEVETGLAELRGAAASASPADAAEVARVRVRLMYDQSYILFLKGRFRDVATLGAQMLEVASPLPEGERLLLPYFSMSLGAMGLHEAERAFEQLDRSLKGAELQDRRLSMAVIHENAGIIHLRAGQIDAAVDRLRRALDLYRETASDLRAVNAIQALARALLAQGDVQEAQHYGELALSHAIEGRDRWAAECYDHLGVLAVLRAEWTNAATSFERALAIHETVGDLADMADSLTGLGTVAELRGEWSRAERFYRRAIAIADQMDPSPEQIWPRRQLARVLMRRGSLAEANESLTRALALCESMPPTIEYGPTLLVDAERRLRAGQPAQASAILQRALGQAQPVDVQVEAHALNVEASLVAGDATSAGHHAAETMRLARRLGTPRQLGLAHLAAGRLAAAAGDHLTADSAFEEAQRVLEEAQAPYDLAIALRSHGRMLAATPEGQARGQILLDLARSSFERIGARPAE